MRSFKKPAWLATLLLLLGALDACSSSAPPASSTSASGGSTTQTVTGIAVPRSVAVVTANNAT